MIQEWNSFARVKAALEHKEADRIPFDLGGSETTAMSKIAYQKLVKYIGLKDRPIRTFQLVTQLAEIDEDVHEYLKTDVRPLLPYCGSDDENKVMEEEDYHFIVDRWGIKWKMPKGRGKYFDICKHPLAEAQSMKDVEAYFQKYPETYQFSDMESQAEKYIEQKKAFILGRDSGGILEMALWLRGFSNFFMDLGINPSFAEGLLDQLVEVKCIYWKKVLDLVGDKVHIVSEADDLGMQNNLMISEKMYRGIIKPRHKKLLDFIRKNAKNEIYISFHSCGAIKSLIPDLIEIGVNILNPVQVNAAGMDTKELKRLFGRDITFWGGGVDTQKVLPFGSPQEVREETKRRIEDLAPGGGFVFNPVHSVQGDVPAENYMAMWETLQEYGKYD